MTESEKAVMQQALDAFETIFKTTTRYRGDGRRTFSDRAISTANKAIADLDAAIAQPAPVRQPFSYEQDSALCEANCNAESEAFFAARPTLDFPQMRRIFYAGHRRAWISYPTASQVAQPVQLDQPIGYVAKDGFTILYFQAERLPFETELYIKQGGAL